MVLVWLIAAYLGAGVVTAIAFAITGAPRLIPGGASVSAGARVLLMPGAFLLWPLVVRRWLGSRETFMTRSHRTAHRLVWPILLVVVGALFLAALLLRPPPAASAPRSHPMGTS